MVDPELFYVVRDSVSRGRRLAAKSGLDPNEIRVVAGGAFRRALERPPLFLHMVEDPGVTERTILGCQVVFVDSRGDRFEVILPEDPS